MSSRSLEQREKSATSKFSSVFGLVESKMFARMQLSFWSVFANPIWCRPCFDECIGEGWPTSQKWLPPGQLTTKI